ncbi:diguanylate cyclase [Sideroxydans lithotrophicus]|uniref:Diguanylate cyclase with PAS/PAC sensor n=1 Tax=Sideroxydans lithotrophicus (strain ES-1) TaxID=580332 RepID=D5CSF5_SIDLE|nr:diguanylate cyclase [Sideroxydans lithotrophicus]ADE11891.1 diguanylate cyclase with PAS/PAC sensor [Sideroxydans lithotrophicus ES-1]
MKIFRQFSTLWRGSIRRQLILGFAIASLALMLGFGYLILQQQRGALYQSSEERASSLARALAISGTSWALANDLVGLQEVVQGFARTQDLQRAYFLNPHGEVLASTNPDEVGFFVTDKTSRDMLASLNREQAILVNQPNLIVIAQPVLDEGRFLGWVRVEMTRDTVNENLAELTRMWIEFILFAVLAVSLIALLLARRLTRGLSHLMQVAAAVEHGWGKRRSDMGRADEIGVLARHLDRMLDALEDQKKLIHESEAKYRFLADNISDVIWVLEPKSQHWVYMSPSISKLLGYSVDEIMQYPMEKTLTAESRADVQRWIRERSEIFLSGTDGDHVYLDEVGYCRRDGSVVWCEVTTSFARNERNEMILLGVMRDITERKKAEEQIRNLAFYDTLTQLPNRRLLQDRFSLVISACKRNNRYAALMFIDLDNFKPLNDEHGHDVGDILLVEVARRIVKCVREVDTVSRFGGDEFVVMLSELDTDKDISVDQANVVAEKIRQSLGETYRLAVSKKDGVEPHIVEHHCTASIGVVLFNDHGVTQEDLIRLADAAMYQAKAAGRNRVCFADS